MLIQTRRNLAYWFALSMGSIFVIFAGISYAVIVESQIDSSDQALLKRGKAIASGMPFRLRQNPLSLNGELVYARQYTPDRTLYQSVGSDAPPVLVEPAGLRTLRVSPQLWVRQATLPVSYKNQFLGYLQIAVPLTPVQDNLNRLRLFLSLSVPLTMGVIGVAGWFLGGIALKPTQRSYERLQRFTADASHELRAPLAAILSNAQVGTMSPDEPAEQQRRLEIIATLAKSTSGLISNLLFLARHDGTLDPTRLQRIDLNLLIRELAQAPPETLQFIVESPDAPVWIDADPDLLKQAIANLLTNAFKYTPEAGTVRLQLQKSAQRAIVSVQDTGIGIPEVDLPHIFERFYRVDTARSRSTGGFGLGLAIAQQIIDSHQGTLRVNSVLEQGSTFWIELPLKLGEKGR
jgi:two-component system, OmpR family, manganese sensing sensor histidine kinase